jgi:FkbM family methyltransferase
MARLHPQARRVLIKALQRNPALYSQLYKFKWWLQGPKEKDLALLSKAQFRYVIDVGANKGQYSYFLSKRSQKVYAFEPNPYCQSIIRSLRIPNIDLFPYALGAAPGTCKLHVPVVGSPLDSLGTIKPRTMMTSMHQFSTLDIEAVQQYRIEIKAFDDLDLDNQDQIDLVKIDVEGAETEVLKGMQCFLRSHEPILLVEIEEWRNPDWQELFLWLQQIGYLPFVSYDGIRIEKVVGNYIQLQKENESLHKRRYIFNYFFLKESSKRQLGGSQVISLT